MTRIGTAIFLSIGLCAAVHAQTFPGQLPAWTIVGNPSGSASIGRSATITQMLDGAFCSTPGATLMRGASAWSCHNLPFVVGSLPTCNSGSKGVRETVTDGLAPTFLAIITGGGTVFSPVICNGTNWVAG